MHYRARSLAALLLVLALVFSSCAPALNDDPSDAQGETKYKVSFLSETGKTLNIVWVKAGEPVTRPNTAPYKQNYIFAGWHLSKTSVMPYDFSTPVTSDLTLYAQFDLDAEKIVAQASTLHMHSVAKVRSVLSNALTGGAAPVTKEGMGFCFHLQNGNCYMIVPYHLVKKDPAYLDLEITVEDWAGNTYPARIYTNSNKGYSAVSAEYDLACIYFKQNAGVSHIPALSLSQNPPVDSDLFSLGPAAEDVVCGKALCYEDAIPAEADSELNPITFPVLRHSACGASANIGAPILNTDFLVVAINYAVSEDRTFAIPASKIQEFLTTFVYN